MSFSAGGQKGGRDSRWWKRTPLLLVIVPVLACVVLVVWRVSGFKFEKKMLVSVVLTLVTAMPHSKYDLRQFFLLQLLSQRIGTY